MPRIRLKVSNVNDAEYNKIILRKFFNMVFFSEDGKKLTIYTATVFGGMYSSPEIKDGKYIPTYHSETECTVKFQYEVEELQAKDSQPTVKFEDLTKSFCEQTEYVQKVWGKFEKYNTQTEVDGGLNKLYPDTHLEKISMTNNEVYHIYEHGKSAAYEFIATWGEYRHQEEDKYSSYTLSGTEKKNGLEYINWIRSEISLPESLFNKRVKFEIILERGEKGIYYTPDFTWYFAPPGGYHVDRETAEVDVGEARGNRNYVQSVADDTTVYFREWENEELIDERKKVRVDLKEYTLAPEQHKLSDKKQITVKLTVTNPNHSANKQFFMGLLVAFLLAFCADKTRMNDFYQCLQENCEESICRCQRYSNLFSLIFPMVMLLSYVSLIFKLKRCVPVKRGKKYYAFYGFKFLGILAAALLVIYAFGLWMVAGAEIMGRFITTCKMNWIIITALALASISFNLIYIVYCTKFRKKKVFNNL